MLETSYGNIARKLELPEQHERDQDPIQAVKDWLEDHTNWLLIMDNADDLSLARSFFPTAHDGHILLTTRTQIVGKVARKIEVEKMDPEEGQLFLLRRSVTSKVKATLKDFATDTREAALRVVELLDGHPLALDQAGAYIEGGVSLTDYIDHYNEQRRCLLEDRGPLDDDHPESVFVTFELCFEKACAQHPLATDILCFCSFLHPDAIPDELFKHDDNFKLDRIAFKKGIEALLRFSLMKCNAQEKTFSMHRLVQAVLIDAMTPDLQKQWRAHVVQVVWAAFQVVEVKESWQFERLLPHILVCARWTEDELTPTEGAGELFYLAAIYIADHYIAGNYIYRHGGGKLPVQETLLSRALAIREALLGTEHLDIADVLFKLGLVYIVQNKNGQTELVLSRALAIREALLGTEDHGIILCLYLLADLYKDQGRYAQAELLALRALKISEKHPGDEYLNIYTGTWVHFLLRLYDAAGQREQTEALYQRYPSLLHRRRLHRRMFDAKSASSESE